MFTPSRLLNGTKREAPLPEKQNNSSSFNKITVTHM
jgi:hypothetical protein